MRFISLCTILRVSTLPYSVDFPLYLIPTKLSYTVVRHERNLVVFVGAIILMFFVLATVPLKTRLRRLCLRLKVPKRINNNFILYNRVHHLWVLYPLRDNQKFLFIQYWYWLWSQYSLMVSLSVFINMPLQLINFIGYFNTKFVILIF